MGFDGDNFSMYSKWFALTQKDNGDNFSMYSKWFALTQKDNFVQIAEHRYQVETSFFSPDGALLRWVGTLTQLWVNKCIVRCNWSPNGLQNACKMFERRLKTVERSSQSTPSFLRSQSEVAGYMGGRLQVSDKSHRPPGLPLNYWSTSDFIFLLNFSCRCTTTLEGRSDRH